MDSKDRGHTYDLHEQTDRAHIIASNIDDFLLASFTSAIIPGAHDILQRAVDALHDYSHLTLQISLKMENGGLSFNDAVKIVTEEWAKEQEEKKNATPV